MSTAATEIVLDPVESSKLAGLRYVTDSIPGITRRRRGKSFQYFDPEGKPVRDKEVLARIKSLVIPLGNTPAVCRKCYVHPTVLESYMSGELIKTLEAAEKKMRANRHSLRDEEVQLMFLLEGRLKAAA
jgi:DNA topoisomerase IB